MQDPSITDEPATRTSEERAPTAGSAESPPSSNGGPWPEAETPPESLETRLLSNEQARQFAAFRHRQLFAQAQEQFTAGEFVEANRTLKEIPDDARTPDVQRLVLLVAERIREVAQLRSTIQTALNQGKRKDLQPGLLRLLELQPGDEWANTIRHRIEEEEHARAAAAKTAAQRELIFNRPTQLPDEPAQPKTHAAVPMERRRPPAVLTGTAAVEIVPDDAEVDEVWEFGERLVSASPPPLKGTAARPQSPRVRPVSSKDDDDIGWLEPEGQSSLGIWIAIAVCGVVTLLALVATVVVLLLERGT